MAGRYDWPFFIMLDLLISQLSVIAFFRDAPLFTIFGQNCIFFGICPVVSCLSFFLVENEGNAGPTGVAIPFLRSSPALRPEGDRSSVGHPMQR